MGRTSGAKGKDTGMPPHRRGTARGAPTMDGPEELFHTWHSKGDPRGRPAMGRHILALLHFQYHSPAKSWRRRVAIHFSALEVLKHRMNGNLSGSVASVRAARMAPVVSRGPGGSAK